MITVTLCLPDDTALRLKQLAASRGISLNKLMEELGTAAIAAHDAETRFRVMAARGDRDKALAILDRLDAGDQSEASQVARARVPGVLKGKIPSQPADAWDFPADLAAIMEGDAER